jgi:hypothetical protein
MRLISFIGGVSCQSTILPSESLYNGSTGAWHASDGLVVELDECLVSDLDSIAFDLANGTSQMHGNQAMEQYETLMTFYNSTNGDSWYRADRWGTGDPCMNEWFGVGCDCQGYVVSLALPNNGLSGTIPSVFSRLSRLSVIDLHSSTLGIELSSTSHVNVLSGDVPSLQNQTLLTVLDLRENDISGLSSNLSANAKLRVLALSGNNLTSFPVGLEYLRSLRILELRDNSINDTVPTGAICNMSNIYVLDLGNNTLTGSFYDRCLEALNPLVFDLSGRHPWSTNTPSGGLTGIVPKSLVQTWTNIQNGYLSFYLQFGIEGHFASTCAGVRICRPSNFMSHEDLAWTQGGADVPEIVYQSIQLAS